MRSATNPKRAKPEQRRLALFRALWALRENKTDRGLLARTSAGACGPCTRSLESCELSRQISDTPKQQPQKGKGWGAGRRKIGCSSAQKAAQSDLKQRARRGWRALFRCNQWPLGPRITSGRPSRSRPGPSGSQPTPDALRRHRCRRPQLRGPTSAISTAP